MQCFKCTIVISHISRVHGEKFNCGICDKNFSQKCRLKTHIKRIHPKYSSECQYNKYAKLCIARRKEKMLKMSNKP